MRIVSALAPVAVGADDIAGARRVKDATAAIEFETYTRPCWAAPLGFGCNSCIPGGILSRLSPRRRTSEDSFSSGLRGSRWRESPSLAEVYFGVLRRLGRLMCTLSTGPSTGRKVPCFPFHGRLGVSLEILTSSAIYFHCLTWRCVEVSFLAAERWVFRTTCLSSGFRVARTTCLTRSRKRYEASSGTRPKGPGAADSPPLAAPPAGTSKLSGPPGTGRKFRWHALQSRFHAPFRRLIQTMSLFPGRLRVLRGVFWPQDRRSMILNR